eukprot:8266062-Alexandrium_andersonii.AAC.1
MLFTGNGAEEGQILLHAADPGARLGRGPRACPHAQPGRGLPPVHVQIAGRRRVCRGPQGSRLGPGAAAEPR